MLRYLSGGKNLTRHHHSDDDDEEDEDTSDAPEPANGASADEGEEEAGAVMVVEAHTASRVLDVVLLRPGREVRLLSFSNGISFLQC